MKVLDLCCASGKVKLTPLVPPPEPLHSLVPGNEPDSKHFSTHIQQYNNCFQITSFGATKVIQENCMPTFNIKYIIEQVPYCQRRIVPTSFCKFILSHAHLKLIK